MRAKVRARSLVEREPYLVAIVAVFVLALVRQAPNELVQDTWLTLVSGREIVQHGLPAHETLTAFADGSRWIDQQWLAQLLFYGTFVVGGLKAVVFFHVLALASAFTLAVTVARRASASMRAVFWVAALTMLIAPWGWQVRAQSLAYLPFVGVLTLLVRGSREPSRRVLLALPLLVVWANLHGSVVVGIVLTMLCGASLMLRRDARGIPLLVVAPFCALASPYGLSLIGYYRHMLVEPLFAKMIGEWQPPTIANAAPFFVVALATLALLARARRAVTLFETLAVVVTIVGGCLAIRSVTWFVFAAVVILPRVLDEVWPSRAVEYSKPVRWLARVGAVATPVVLTALVLSPASWLEKDWPNHAAVTVAASSDRVIASERYADWLLWKVPQLRGRLAYDVRFEINSDSQLREIYAFRNKTGRNWARAAAGYPIVVLDGNSDRSIRRSLVSLGWNRILSDKPNVTVLERPTYRTLASSLDSPSRSTR